MSVSCVETLVEETSVLSQLLNERITICITQCLCLLKIITLLIEASFIEKIMIRRDVNNNRRPVVFNNYKLNFGEEYEVY